MMTLGEDTELCGVQAWRHNDKVTCIPMACQLRATIEPKITPLTPHFVGSYPKLGRRVRE